MKKEVFDIECYKNYFLIMFKNIDSGQVNYLQMHDGVMSGNFTDRIQLKSHMEKITSVGFNSLHYDMPMVAAYIKRFDNDKLKEVSDHIIKGDSRHWQTTRKFRLGEYKFDHIDIKEPAPGVMTSLKIYGGRANAPKLQDLPIEPDAVISKSQAKELREYCINDLDTTIILYKKIEKQIALRETLTDKYGVDMRSKSDAQMAEAIFKVYLEAEGITVAKRVEPVLPFKFDIPEWAIYESPVLVDILNKISEHKFEIKQSTGKVILPSFLTSAFDLYGYKYKMGIGGLHDQNKNHSYEMDDDHLMLELDGTSFYPTIISTLGLYPKHLGPKFLNVYRNVLATRIKAKREGDVVTDKTYKILLNGTFGKYSSVYSYLYSPELLLQITLTGQLSLLLLVEMMEEKGIRTVSSNTDGNVIILHKSQIDDMREVAFDWELRTGLVLEETFYKAIYMTNVNNYVAIKTDGEVKGKGTYADLSLMKNPVNYVCTKAIREHLDKGTPITDFIRSDKDITNFITVRTVNGGAMYEGEDVGKAVRFYHSTNGGVITYKKNGNKVPTSDGCKPLMSLPDKLPNDIDYQWYIDNTNKLLDTLGIQ